eukprot:2419220-Pleurochrysis_carterae.AAC.1
MLLGLSFTPARQGGCEPERADPYVHVNVHRSVGREMRSAGGLTLDISGSFGGWFENLDLTPTR